MVGQSPGNGHPYSWSAIINGYDRERMESECPFPTIPYYLGLEPEASFGFDGVRVTHVCCTGAGEFTAESVAACARIPRVVADPVDMIGAVDAVVIATDLGYEQVERARPFVEAGIPVFLDKPLTDNEDDLITFLQWVDDGAHILSSSALRYAKEFAPYRASTRNLGDLRLVTITMAKLWETYGIHALEAVYPILGPGFLTCRNTGASDRNIVHFTHECGADVVVAVRTGIKGGSGLLTIVGTEKSVQTRNDDTFYAFRAQLAAFVEYLRTGVRPFAFSETGELMRMVIAGTVSRERGGESVRLADLAGGVHERS